MTPSQIACPACSAQVSTEHRFCPSCGVPVSSLSQAPTSAPSVPAAPVARRLASSDTIPTGGFTPGMILADRYRIIGLLGRGGMGEVYRADDLKLGQPVALKFLPKTLAADPVRRERFFAEVRITRQLSHPNICRVYDIAEFEGQHFLSMEYIDGEDLAVVIDAPQVSLPIGLAQTALFVLMVRHGLVATLSFFYCAELLTNFPLTFDASAWYAPYGFAALGVFTAIALISFRTSLGSRVLDLSRIQD